MRTHMRLAPQTTGLDAPRGVARTTIVDMAFAALHALPLLLTGVWTRRMAYRYRFRASAWRLVLA